jgi:hypothetical protein
VAVIPDLIPEVIGAAVYPGFIRGRNEVRRPNAKLFLTFYELITFDIPRGGVR